MFPLVQSDIASIGSEIGTFDYIIAHGVYSWVDDGVKEALLRLIDEHLAEDGIAYISLIIPIQVGIRWTKYVS